MFSDVEKLKRYLSWGALKKIPTTQLKLSEIYGLELSSGVSKEIFYYYRWKSSIFVGFDFLLTTGRKLAREVVCFLYLQLNDLS
jgi:hypothetical protein